MNSPLSDFLMALSANRKAPTFGDFNKHFGDFYALNEDRAVPIPNAPVEVPLRAMPIPNDDSFANNPQESPTFRNAPPVGQTGNPDPLPFYKYMPPVGQDVINWTPCNPDPYITIDEAPPVQQSSPFSSLEAMLQFLKAQRF